MGMNLKKVLHQKVGEVANNVIIDPYTILESKLPLIVCVDDRRSLLGFLIKSHSGGNYNHICEFHQTDLFASQDPQGYREVPISNYIKPYLLMKFWSVKDITDKQKKLWREIIEADLNAPWKFRAYDILGFLGQALNIPWLQNSHKKYCSERVASHLIDVFDMDLPKYPTPSALNEVFKKMPNMEVMGYYFQD
jgi:hypothetical protein